MVTVEAELLTHDRNFREVATEYEYEKWHHWPVNWSAIWVGTLAALGIILLVGLIATAVGAQLLGPENRVVDLKKIAWASMIIGVCGAFFSFVGGGWIAGKIAGILRSEPAMLHGAIVWLVAVPLMALAGAIGARGYLGGWYSGIAGGAAPTTTRAVSVNRAVPSATGATSDLPTLNLMTTDDFAKATRNSALFAITSLLLGLMGSVIGGWMASGEPMTFTYHRHRPKYAANS